MWNEAFEWDAPKARSNLIKHGVSFEAASRVFDDLFAVERLDEESDASEIRSLTTGMVNDVLLTVVHTERGERIRIISARKATGYEQQDYYRGQTSG